MALDTPVRWAGKLSPKPAYLPAFFFFSGFDLDQCSAAKGANAPVHPTVAWR
jgi:hypothetical protein